MQPQRVIRGAVHAAKLAQHSRGDFRKLCLQCGAECAGLRRNFCSNECVHLWKLKTSTSYIRRCLEKRDKGVCACCDTDTGKLKEAFYAYRAKLEAPQRDAAIRDGLATFSPEDWRYVAESNERAFEHWGRGNGIPAGRLYKSWWDADHILPVAEGGGECGLSNYQTLCLRCHKAKTTEQASRKALARRTAPLFEV